MWLSRDLPPRREWMWQLIIRMLYAFPKYLEATPNSNPSISWANPSSTDLLSESLSTPADTDSFTSSESLWEGRTQKNGKLRLRDQPGFCESPQTQIIQPKSPSTRPLSHSTDYGSDYEEPRPAVSPQDGALSEKQREEALRDQNKALSDDDHFKCKHPPFFIPVCCLGSLDLAELMVQGQTVFERVELCVSCKLVCFLDATLRGSVYLVVIGWQCSIVDTSNPIMVPLINCIAHGYLFGLCCENFHVSGWLPKPISR